MSNTAKILIRFTPEERQRLKNAAWIDRLSLQEYCHRELMIAAEATYKRHEPPHELPIEEPTDGKQLKNRGGPLEME